MNTERLLTLATFLEQLPPEQWEYTSYVSEVENECGTVCCALGWMPKVDPANWSCIRLNENIYPRLIGLAAYIREYVARNRLCK